MRFLSLICLAKNKNCNKNVETSYQLTKNDKVH